MAVKGVSDDGINELEVMATEKWQQVQDFNVIVIIPTKYTVCLRINWLSLNLI